MTPTIRVEPVTGRAGRWDAEYYANEYRDFLDSMFARWPSWETLSEAVGCINSVSCCRSFVFVDEAAEQVASSDRRGWSGGAVPSRRCLDRVGGL